jgi:MFS transporter, FSR family, fosmidomycin resistance protein
MNAMTPATLDGPVRRAGDARVIAVASSAHFVSHYYILLLPPLFDFVRAEYAVSYTELGLALAAFNVVSAVLQTPAGFLVDRVGARVVLIAGLLLGASGFAMAGIVHSFWLFVLMFGVAGLGNTVYHPGDYALLSQRVSPSRIGQAFSVHTFAGMLGSAVAPASLLLMQAVWGWRGAFLGAAALGFTVAGVLAFQGPGLAERPSLSKRVDHDAAPTGSGWGLLFSAPIVRNLLFFVLLAIMGAGLQNYSVVALGALYGMPPTLASTPLTAYLLLSAIGVLAGGFIVGRTARHGLVTAIGLLTTAAMAVVIGFVDLGAVLLSVVMGAGGFFSGIVMPSRDMIVREVTPPGSFGKVFGFVTTGFNIGGIVSPFIFGALMDHGLPRAIFFCVAACCLVSIATVLTRPDRTVTPLD